MGQEHSPPREEAWTRRGRVVAHTECRLVSDHPVCGAKMGFAEIFLMPQPPLLTHEEGIRYLFDDVDVLVCEFGRRTNFCTRQLRISAT